MTAMLLNYHLHSVCSFDADYPLTDMCAAAVSGGIRELCLTDHCDLIDEFGKVDDSFDWVKENDQLDSARKAYPGLTIRKGVELGQAMLRPEAAQRILAEPGIDFVLGSMHNCMDGRDFYHIHPNTKDDCMPLIESYLGTLLALSGTDYFDSLAHLTYPLRYLRVRAELDVDFHPFDDLVDEILKKLICRGKALELNVSGYRNNGGEPLPPEYMLKLYRERGGELITIGTDAHEPAHVSDGLEQGMALLRKCGFRWITTYQNRKPQQLLLE